MKLTIKDRIVNTLQTGSYTYGGLTRKLYEQGILTQTAPRETARLRSEYVKGDILQYKGKQYTWIEEIKGNKGVKYFSLKPLVR